MTRRRQAATARCSALQLTGFLCGRGAWLWVDRSGQAEPRCAMHARAYRVVWPILTADAEADRALAEGVFV